MNQHFPTIFTYVCTLHATYSKHSPRPYLECKTSIGYMLILEQDPILLGHPHEQAEPQLTEPFWQQYPSWTNPNQPINNHIYSTTFYYPPVSTAAMDSQTLYIGSNTKNGQKGSGSTNAVANRSFHKEVVKPKGKVDVFIDDEFIREMPLGTLIRFSKAAAAAFPKPKPGKEAQNRGEADSTPQDWAEDDEKEVNVEQLTAQVENLSANPQATEASSKGTEPGAAIASPTANAVSSTKIPNQVLDLKLDTLWRQPPVTAFNFAFEWMHLAKVARPGDTVLEYGVPRPVTLSLENMVDIYAAALCLDLRPFPHRHRHALMGRVTDKRPLVADLTYVHEHLPINDPVMTRMISSFFHHRDVYNSYSKAELNLINEYVYNVDKALFNRFGDIGEHRKQNQEAFRRQRREDRMQQFAEGLETADVDGKPVLHKAVNGEGKTDGTGRRRNRHKSENKGKETNGKSGAGVKH